MFNNLGTLISTKLFGKYIGQDNFDNIYYINKNIKKKKRWVIYYKNNDASSIPPEWQAWLTKTTDEIPNSKNTLQYKWQIAHEPNLTGLNNLYQKSIQKLEKKNKKYSAWIPKKKGKQID